MPRRRHQDELTQAQIEAYVRTGTRCPRCLSHEIEAGPFETDERTLWCEVTCFNCGFRWDDIYVLSSIDPTTWHIPEWLR